MKYPKKYKDFYIKEMRVNGKNYYRVKDDPDNNFAIHHGSFKSVLKAKKFIDNLEKEKI